MRPALGRLTLVGVVLLLGLAPAQPVQAQSLELKRTVPGEDGFACPVVPPPAPAPAADREAAAELASVAAQAVILGELDRARELLDQATRLDPGSAEISFQYARVLQDRGAAPAALEAYCRVVALAPGGSAAREAQVRLDALGPSAVASPPDDAVEAYRRALRLADEGEPAQAASALDVAVREAPDWADPVYNRGVVRARSGAWEGAREDLERYLALRPDAPDAAVVSRTLDRLGSLADRPAPGVVLVAGLLPSAGQFYSGRPAVGAGVLGLVGGALAAGLLVEEVQVLCLSDPGPDGACPPGDVLEERTERPYLAPGLGAAVAITALAAVEAFLHVRRDNARAAAFAVSSPGDARIVGPELERVGPRGLGVRLIGLRH